MKIIEREKRIFEKYGIIIQRAETKVETGKIYYTGTAKQFERYIKSRQIQIQ